MKFIPEVLSRAVAEKALLTEKHAPAILLGAGIVSMVGSTVMACRATLKMNEVLDEIEANKTQSREVKHLVDSKAYTGDATYTDEEMRKDTAVIYIRGVAKIVRLYAPAIVIGGVGIACLTKSHMILQERNVALTAAYVAVDSAFRNYRKRVIDRYGEDVDRELRYETEEVDLIDEETGKITSLTRVAPGEPSGYARWFDETNPNWHPPAFEEYNWVFLRNQQNWANDLLKARGHLFLNEAYRLCGLTDTSAGSVVGWVYERDNDRGDNYVDFGCWDQQKGEPVPFFNGRDGAILLDFNVDGSIWELIDKYNEERAEEQRRLDS